MKIKKALDILNRNILYKISSDVKLYGNKSFFNSKEIKAIRTIIDYFNIHPQELSQLHRFGKGKK